MGEYQGIGMNPGLALGKIKVWRGNDYIPEKTDAQQPKEELACFRLACQQEKEQLDPYRNRARKVQQDEVAKIIEGHQLILEDDEFLEAIEAYIITEKVSAAYAVHVIGKRYAEMFAAMDSEYMKARAADVSDVSRRLIRILQHQKEELQEEELRNEEYGDEEKMILVANELGPGDILKMDTLHIGGFVTRLGSVRSHAAILANSRQIPAMIVEQLELEALKDGQLVILDGENGIVQFDPDEGAVAKLRARLQKKQEEEVNPGKGAENGADSDIGGSIRLCANIGSVEEARLALQNGCQGIGLFRSEMLYLGRRKAPSEEEQYAIYHEVATLFGVKPVVIRTLDLGSDKMPDYLEMPTEKNPALGLRGIRFCLTHKELWKVQLRALFRAAVAGNLHIMYPMISAEEELDAIGAIVEEVKEELTQERIKFAMPKQGIMIETPAAVFASQQLAKRVDFFSIGTNDLAQYAQGIDRENAALEAFYQPHHPAIFHMIKMVVENGHQAGIWIGLCGSLGEDETLIETFLQLGIDELSMTPSAIPPIRNCVRRIGQNKH